MTVTSTTTSTSSTGGTTSALSPTTTLGKDDFLRLLVTQLKYQDPLSPTDQTQFMAQMAQFSTVEGITNLETTLSAMGKSADVSQAVALIGKQLSYTAADGSVATGLAASVSVTDGEPAIKVGSDSIALSDVLSVAGA